MTSQERVQATVLPKVARLGLQPWRRSGVRTTPRQNSAWERADHSSCNMPSGDDEDQDVDGIETGEAGEPELALAEGDGAVGVVVGEDEAGEQEEEADEDVGVVDDGVEQAEVRRGEVEEDDADGEEGADAGEGGQRGFAGVALELAGCADAAGVCWISGARMLAVH